MEIKNKTKRALAVSLPGGKKLRLGPGKTGQITSKAVDFPAVQKMIEAEELEVIGGGRGKGSQDSGTNASGTKSQTGGGGEACATPATGKGSRLLNTQIVRPATSRN